MARSRTVFRCMSCGAGAPKWSGRCAGCGDWNTLSEELEVADPAPFPLAPPTAPTPITRLAATEGRPVPTGVSEFDRVLGGGLVPGSVTLLGGEPGVGKSTLVLQLLAARARAGATVLYVTGEESVDQVRLRAERLDALDDHLLLAAETALPNLLVHLEAIQPDLCVVDSVQTLHDPQFQSAPGSVTQVRECAHRLVQAAKTSGTTMVLVGHVTKDGQLSGPAGAGARGGHRAVHGGRPPPRPAAAAGLQAPVRLHGGDRPVLRRRHRPGRRAGPVVHVPGRPPARRARLGRHPRGGGPPPPAGGGPVAGVGLHAGPAPPVRAGPGERPGRPPAGGAAAAGQRGGGPAWTSTP